MFLRILEQVCNLDVNSLPDEDTDFKIQNNFTVFVTIHLSFLSLVRIHVLYLLGPVPP